MWDLQQYVNKPGFALVRRVDCSRDCEAKSSTNPGGLPPQTAWQREDPLDDADILRLAPLFALARLKVLARKSLADVEAEVRVAAGPVAGAYAAGSGN